MGCYLRMLIVFTLAFPWGCASDPPPRPAVVSYLDIAKKQAYIENAMSTLKIFHDTAIDLQVRRKTLARKELAGEVEHYIEMQVKPIIGDFEANSSMRTRLEVAELQLLCGLVYLELEEYDEAMAMLKNMKRRYGGNPEMLSASIDSRYTGFRNLEDGMRVLNERIWREF